TSTSTGSNDRRPGVPQAEGGITIGPQIVPVSEWSATATEAHIPLNRGASYFAPLADSVSRAVLMQLHTAGRGISSTGTGAGTYYYSDDHSARFSGDINVSAANLQDLIRQLNSRRRLSMLASPARRGR